MAVYKATTKKQKIKATESTFSGGLLFVLLFGFIVVFSVVNLIIPTKEFSENENKYLTQLPAFRWNDLVSGEFAQDFEQYVNEQFLLRDEWITVKSVAEYALLKTENNGVAYGKDGYMFVKFPSFGKDTLQKNLEALDAFAYDCPAEVSVIVVPSSYSVLENKLPKGLPQVDEAYYIERINSYLNSSCAPVDASAALSEHADEYIYYRTDHHWTTYGAWLVYKEFAAQRGLEPFDYAAHTPVSVDGFLGTSYSKSKAFNSEPDTLEYFDELNGTITREGETYDSIYNYEQFTKRDKYSGLLYGNTGIIQIDSEYSADKRESILIIRDSFADSLAPFLTEHYNRIVLVDPRYYNKSISELAAMNFSDVLVLFGFEDFATVKQIAALKPADFDAANPTNIGDVEAGESA